MEVSFTKQGIHMATLCKLKLVPSRLSPPANAGRELKCSFLLLLQPTTQLSTMDALLQYIVDNYKNTTLQALGSN